MDKAQFRFFTLKWIFISTADMNSDCRCAKVSGECLSQKACILYLAPFLPSSSLFSEWGYSAVWHIHLLSSGAKLLQARWQKAVISPPPRVIQGQGVSEIPVKSLPAARLEWVSDDGTFHWVSVKANIHAKTEGEKNGDLSGICQVHTPFEHLCWWDATKENSGGWVDIGSYLPPKKPLWAQLLSRTDSFLEGYKYNSSEKLSRMMKLFTVWDGNRNEKKNVASDETGRDCLVGLNGFHST